VSDATHQHEPGAGCLAAHGDQRPDLGAGTLVTVYVSPVAEVLLRWGRELGFRTVLLDPDADRIDDHVRAIADEVVTDPSAVRIDAATDVAVCDHHRADLGPVMGPLVAGAPRWIGIMGNPRHEGPHVAALRAEGYDAARIATVRRPIGVDIGSKAPAEIALSTLAELVARRNGRSAGLP
jgi:xanthine/CO dehydrogenase XdhC/CoxF family maturation factor